MSVVPYILLRQADELCRTYILLGYVILYIIVVNEVTDYKFWIASLSARNDERALLNVIARTRPKQSSYATCY